MMSADIARNLSLVCSCLDSYYSTFPLFSLLILFQIRCFCTKFNRLTTFFPPYEMDLPVFPVLVVPVSYKLYKYQNV